MLMYSNFNFTLNLIFSCIKYNYLDEKQEEVHEPRHDKTSNMSVCQVWSVFAVRSVDR